MKIIRRLDFTPDGRHLLTTNANGTVFVLRLASAKAAPAAAAQPPK